MVASLSIGGLAIQPRRRSADRIGERNGKLVIEAIERRPAKRRSTEGWFVVRCDCGTRKAIPQGNFKRVKSCGCGPTGGAAHTGIPLVGRRFGLLTVIATSTKPGTKTGISRCRCDCGVERDFRTTNVCSGSTLSCGCLTAALRSRIDPDAMVRHPLHGVWNGMIQRCTNATTPNYGARGIRVCDRWASDFWAFVADMGERPEGTSIDRINNDGGYTCGRCEDCYLRGAPSNCRWATDKQQAQNTRRNVWIEHNGRRMVASDWAKEIGCSRELIRLRLLAGLPIEQVLAPLQRPVPEAQRRAMSKAAKRRYRKPQVRSERMP